MAVELAFFMVVVVCEALWAYPGHPGRETVESAGPAEEVAGLWLVFHIYLRGGFWEAAAPPSRGIRGA